MITPSEVRVLHERVGKNPAQLLEEMLDRMIQLQWPGGQDIVVPLSHCGSVRMVREVLKKYLPHWKKSWLEISKTVGVVLHIAE